MKKLLFIVLLSLISSKVFADVGLFFNDTARYARTGIIKANVDADLYRCQSYAQCNNIALSHQRVAVFFSNYAAMKAEFQRRINLGYISAYGFVHTKKTRNFRIDVYDVVDIEGREFVLFGIKTRDKQPKTNRAVAIALVDEIYQAYDRSAY